MGSFIDESVIDLTQNQTTPETSQPLVLFQASSLGHVEQGGSFTVLAGPRLTLRKNQRHQLNRSLAKALYGRQLDQNFQQLRNREFKHSPIGMRLQRYAFAASVQKTAKYASW